MMRVLFVCSRNSVRSPMAEQLLRATGVADVASAGVVGDELDAFVLAALSEIGLSGPPHPPQALEDLHLGEFDTVVALSDDAEAAARALYGDKIERWNVPDPTETGGNREQRLDAYRAVRDLLAGRIRERFGTA
ncbi:low molecular weight phosphatase family protein [Roseiterribacter gracilis]|uniref:Protein-tyrosine-phosphatase n=1 Tax=Roseiterribacter gracilis TaxID=2812848 RepID=A0A8S8XBD9_9PROT|nr:protein-tyrosine-phosphatase [Rhodospirillales bacterium TMPK1]